MVQERENTGCSMDEVSKLFCLIKGDSLEPYHYQSFSYHILYCGMQISVSLATMELCTWEEVRRGGRVLQILIMALHDFLSKTLLSSLYLLLYAVSSRG